MWDTEGTAPLVFNLGTRWRWVVSFCYGRLTLGKIAPPPSRCTINRSLDELYLEKKKIFCMISGFRREVDQIRVLLGCYAASSGNSISTCRSYLQGSRHLEGETDRLSRNVGKELSLIAAWYSHPRNKEQNDISQKSANLRIISYPCQESIHVPRLFRPQPSRYMD
jgi:hypothetical protein